MGDARSCSLEWKTALFTDTIIKRCNESAEGELRVWFTHGWHGQDWKKVGLRMRSVTWDRLPVKKCADWFNPSPFWRSVAWIQICASLNHRKVKKAEPSRLIPWKLSANLEFLTVRGAVSGYRWSTVGHGINDILKPFWGNKPNS